MMMSHRKACSQGSIPFSWEDSPGVSKSTTHRRRHDDEASPPPPPSGRRSIAHPGMGASDTDHGSLLPPPPPSSSSSCDKLRRHRRGTLSGKTSSFGRCQLEDPFLAAYMECTKDPYRGWKISNSNGSDNKGNNLLPANQSKKVFINPWFFSSNAGSNNYDSKCKGRKSSKFVFSCKSSCDVEEGSLVARLANLPFIPGDHHRVRRR